MSDRRLDPVDERILRLLVRNGRATWQAIGAAVNLSANAARQRVRRLEENGCIRGYTATLDPVLHGAASEAVVLLQVAVDADADALEHAMAAVPQVVEVLDLTGPVDYEVRVRCEGSRELSDVVTRLRVLPGVTGIETRLVLRAVLTR